MFEISGLTGLVLAIVVPWLLNRIKRLEAHGDEMAEKVRSLQSESDSNNEEIVKLREDIWLLRSRLTFLNYDLTDTFLAYPHMLQLQLPAPAVECLEHEDSPAYVQNRLEEIKSATGLSRRRISDLGDAMNVGTFPSLKFGWTPPDDLVFHKYQELGIDPHKHKSIEDYEDQDYEDYKGGEDDDDDV